MRKGSACGRVNLVRKSTREAAMGKRLLIPVLLVAAMVLWSLPAAAATTSASGTVSAATSTGLTLQRQNGTSLSFTYTGSTTFQKNGVLATAGNILVNDRAEVKYDPSTMSATAVKAWTPRSRKITGMFGSASGNTFTVVLGRGRTISFELDSAANVVKDGVLSSLDQLTSTDQVQVTFVAGSPNRAFTVKARTKPLHASGTVSSVGSNFFVLTTRKGSLTLSVDSQTDIQKSGNVVSLSSLLLGDRAEVKYVASGSGLYALQVRGDDPDDREVKGLVTSVDVGAGTFTVNGMTFEVRSETSIERDDVLIGLSDLAVGNFVEVKYILDGTDLVAISVEVKVQKKKVAGTVVAVDTTAMSLTLQVNGSPMVFCVDSGTEIKKGERRVSLGDLAPGDVAKVEYIQTASCNLAREVEVEDEHEDLEVEGQVTAKGPADFTILAHNGVSLTFQVDGSTIFKRDDHPASFSDLQVGDRVEVHYVNTGGTLLATKVEIED